MNSSGKLWSFRLRFSYILSKQTSADRAQISAAIIHISKHVYGIHGRDVLWRPVVRPGNFSWRMVVVPIRTNVSHARSRYFFGQAATRERTQAMEKLSAAEAETGRLHVELASALAAAEKHKASMMRCG